MTVEIQKQDGNHASSSDDYRAPRHASASTRQISPWGRSSKRTQRSVAAVGFFFSKNLPPAEKVTARSTTENTSSCCVVFGRATFRPLHRRAPHDTTNGSQAHLYVYAQSRKDHRPTGIRQISLLDQFIHNVEHSSDKDNIVPDALSRLEITKTTKPIENMSAYAVAQLLATYWIARFSVPDVITAPSTDQGRQFE